MITIIAEKPSVAQSIATVIGATKKENGYLSGNGYYVTWAFGHLIELAPPQTYGFEGGWEKQTLPIIPEKFKIQPIELKDKKSNALYASQLKTIAILFKKSDKIIVAADAGREGELIFRYVYSFLNQKNGIQTPFVRLWISSLTDKAIKEGMKQLRPGSDYDNMYAAGKARSEADWMIGINGTRATTINVNDSTVWSVGRVQTPTLSMVCKRFLENKNFKSEPYYMIKVQCNKTEIPFLGFNATKFKDRKEAEDKLQEIKRSNSIVITKLEKKPGYTYPPLLYDLTSLQKEANSRYALSADTTLKLCQSLYEKKLTTYPRTGSRYIPDDIYATLPVLIKNAESYSRFSDYAKSLAGKQLGKISVNAAKVTDHHALLPTENIPTDGQMTDAERIIYEMIIARMLETVSPREEKDVTTAILEVEGIRDFPFIVRGNIIRIPGWKGVLNEKQSCTEEENEKLPTLEENEKLLIENIVIMDKHTKAPALLTESTLLALMETAGKELINEEERKALKDIGIGTPATRAETIEKLIRTQYMIREKKSLIPTEKGLALYNTVKDMQIANVEMTGKWENALNKIEQGKIDVAKFNEEIRNYTKKCTDELLSSKIDSSKVIIPRAAQRIELQCPKCGSRFIVTDKVCACTDKEKCGFFFWRVVCQRRLTEKDIKEILANGETIGKVKLKKKDGKTFEAQLVLGNEGKFVFKW